jgi:NAD(P)-dependent dehydrogenase (short-subunit alcohol dehydrogenase family)
MFDVRFWGAVEASKSANIKAGGSIIMTVGQSIIRPPKGWTLPASLLGAVDAAARGLAIDLAPLRVNVVSPGVVKTEVRASVNL